MASKGQVKNWMIANADDFIDDCGEFNCTEAAECAFCEFSDIPDDSEMPYEAAFEAHQAIERQFSRGQQ